MFEICNILVGINSRSDVADKDIKKLEGIRQGEEKAKRKSNLQNVKSISF